MSLTQNQLESLRYDLQTLANIEYDEVLTELLDHYATLTEQKMANSLSFDDASKWSWAELGSGEGLQTIQDDYVRSMRRQIQSRHIEILKSYFHWPAFVTTALIGMVVYLSVPLLPTRFLIGLLLLLSFTPGLFLLWGRRKHLDQHTDARRIVWQYVEASSTFVLQVIPASLNLTNGFFSNSPSHRFFQVHTSLSLVICLLLLLYSISFIQLFREQFIYEPKTA